MLHLSSMTRRLLIVSLSVVFSLAGYSIVRGDDAPTTEPTTQPDIPLPQIPDKTFNIKDYGAVADGTTLNTEAIQKTIDAASAAGGGTVLVPAGQFLTGPIKLASNLDFKVDTGATLLFSDDFKNYKLMPGRKGVVGNGRYEDLIFATDIHDLVISGHGTIDGQGKKWWDMFLPFKNTMSDPAAPPHRPHLLVIHNCKRLLIEDITLTNSPMLHCVPEACQDVTIRGITIKSPATSPNTDGIDPSGINYFITKCTIDNGDDNIALKPVEFAIEGQPSCQDFLITDCTFIHGHGMSIGGQTTGGLKHLVVRDCTFDSNDQGIRLKAPRGVGGLVEDCTYENLTMKNIKKTAIEITSYYPESKIPKDWSTEPTEAVDATTPIWKDIYITNVTITGAKAAGLIVGLPESHISNVVFTNVTIDAKKPLKIANADGIKFVNSQVTVSSGNALDAQNATVEGIDPNSGQPTK
jgi:polygalacturonase